MSPVIFDRIVDTDYGEFSLEWGQNVWDGDSDRFFSGQENGWVGAAVADAVYVILARRSGGSSVRVEILADAPAPDESWEDCVEVSVRIPDGASVRYSTWAAEESGALEIPAGSYRLRVSARGRDAGQAGEFEPEVVDFYLLQLWLAPLSPDAVLRVGSADAAGWHESWGSRRSR
jgi:hypothetical protein